MLTFRRALLFSALIILSLLFLFPKDIPPPPAKPTSSHASSAGRNPILSDVRVGGAQFKDGQVQSSRNQQQVTVARLRDLPLREQLEHRFPYEVSSKFPAYIWQTWKYMPANPQFEQKLRPMEASWTEKHPGFVHEVITDEAAVHLLKHLYDAVPEVLDAYDSLPLTILKADFFRYLILLARGGIYTDIDTTALQPATDWISPSFARNSLGLVIGIEVDPDRADWAQWYWRRIQFCQWTIQSKPGHPILREIVANITERTLEMKRAGKLNVPLNKVFEFTGSVVWTDVIFDYFNDPRYFDMSTSPGKIDWRNFTGMAQEKKVGDVVVLPITSFSPGIGLYGAGETDNPMAFVLHHFEHSWRPDREEHIKWAEDPEKEEKKQKEETGKRKKEGAKAEGLRKQHGHKL